MIRDFLHCLDKLKAIFKKDRENKTEKKRRGKKR